MLVLAILGLPLHVVVGDVLEVHVVMILLYENRSHLQIFIT